MQDDQQGNQDDEEDHPDPPGFSADSTAVQGMPAARTDSVVSSATSALPALDTAQQAGLKVSQSDASPAQPPGMLKSPFEDQANASTPSEADQPHQGPEHSTVDGMKQADSSTSAEARFDRYGKQMPAPVICWHKHQASEQASTCKLHQLWFNGMAVAVHCLTSIIDF